MERMIWRLTCPWAPGSEVQCHCFPPGKKLLVLCLDHYWHLWRVDDEVTEGESEAIVFPLNPDLWRLNHVRIPKLIARKLSESHFQF